MSRGGSDSLNQWSGQILQHLCNWKNPSRKSLSISPWAAWVWVTAGAERSWWTVMVESFERLSAMLMFQGWAQENSTEKYNRWSSESSKQASDIDGLIPEACRNTNRYAILAITALINIVHESTSAKVMNSSNQSTWSACNYSYYHW